MDAIEITATRFWSWFAEHRAEIEADYRAEGPTATLDAMIAEAGFSWEIGPGFARKHMLAISPSGSYDALLSTRRFVSLAPELPDWEIHPAKQKKRGWGMKIDDVDGGSRETVDFADWEFVIHRFDDHMHDVIFRVPPYPTVDRDACRHLSILLLDSEIGEEKRIALIDRLEIVHDWSERDARWARGVALGLLDRFVQGPKRGH